LHQIAYFNIGNHQYYKLDLKGQPMELEIWTDYDPGTILQ
jgi:hypothetical protein